MELYLKRVDRDMKKSSGRMGETDLHYAKVYQYSHEWLFSVIVFIAEW